MHYNLSLSFVFLSSFSLVVFRVVGIVFIYIPNAMSWGSCSLGSGPLIMPIKLWLTLKCPIMQYRAHATMMRMSEHKRSCNGRSCFATIFEHLQDTRCFFVCTSIPIFSPKRCPLPKILVVHNKQERTTHKHTILVEPNLSYFTRDSKTCFKGPTS